MTRFERSSWVENDQFDVRRDSGEEPAHGVVPNTGLHFIDIQIAADAILRTSGRFVEERDAGIGHMLIPVNDGTSGDEPLVHPISGLPLRQDEILWISGYCAIESMLERWLPLPYFRVISRPARESPVLDSGPTNWVRVYLERPPGDIRAATHISAVIAIDTTLASNTPEIGYTGPRLEDAKLDSLFALAHSPQDLADFLSEDWVDRWLQSQDGSDGAMLSADSGAPSGGHLDHVARYLTLTKILGASRQMPQLRFIDHNDARVRQFAVGVDLVLDVGDDQTTALLVERTGHISSAGRMGVEQLNLRDLSRPTVRHSGPFRTLAEFSRADFGSVKLSRKSGRLDAFRWPSLTRVGAEGSRLAMKSSAADGVTGLRSLKSALCDAAAGSTVWRFARDDDQSFEAGSMVAGELLNFLSEDGRVIRSATDELKPAIRPRFSPASLFVMFIAELLLHALSQLNENAASNNGASVRHLDRIVINGSPADSADESRRLANLVQDAIELIWSANNWDERPGHYGHARPDVAVGIDASISAQLIYLFNEVRGKFGGHIALFQDVRGRRYGREAVQSIKIASVAVTSEDTTFSVVDYVSGAEGEVRPSLLIAERHAVNGHAVRRAVASDVLKPALVSALAAAGCHRPLELIEELWSDQSSNGPLTEIGRRFRSKIVEPAASGLLDVLQRLPETRIGGRVRTISFRDLVAMGGHEFASVGTAIDLLARRAGATEFELDHVRVALRPRQLRSSIERSIAPIADRLTEHIRHHAIDLVLLSGRAPVLGDLKRMLIDRLAIAPHLIVRMDSYDCEFLQQVAGRLGVSAPHVLGVVGLVMTDGAAAELGGLTHLSSGLDRLLQSEPREPRLIASDAVEHRFDRPAQATRLYELPA